MEDSISKWNTNIKYIKGDIVLCNNKYFVCVIDHTSNKLCFPSNEDIYWVRLRIKNLSNNNATESIKRKLTRCHDEETNQYSFKKQKYSYELPPRELLQKDDLKIKIEMLNTNSKLKKTLLDKYEHAKRSNGSSESSKNLKWISDVCNIPFNYYKDFIVNKNCPSETIKIFLKSIKQILDNDIHGLEEVKQEILEFIARKITNPRGKGHILALHGSPGIGKTRIIKSLSNALNLPFNQINFGGINDSNILLGHSETYVGSKPGKIAECLINSGCMNPIIYFDEIDKISCNKNDDISGVLTHILDEEQNNKFQDNYFANIELDLSKVFFVMSFNDISKVNYIVKDRLTLIEIDSPSLQDKISIAKDKILPKLVRDMNFDFNIVIDIETIEYLIVSKTVQEKGVRQLHKNIEKILNRLNYDILIENNNIKKENTKDFILTRSYINEILTDKNNYENSFSMMYI